MTTRHSQPILPFLASAGALVALAACGATGASGGADGPDPVELRLVTTQVEDAPENLGVWRLQEILEESAPWITIDYLGGPETMDPFVTAENVATGAVHMANVSSAYYTAVVPEARVFDLTPNAPHEDRASGAHDLINTWHEDSGLYVLGGTTAEFSHMLHFGSRYTQLDADNFSIDGWLMRGTPVTTPMIEEFGGSVVTMPIGDVYTAVERRTIDGFSAGNIGMYELGLTEAIEASLAVELLAVRYPLLFNLSTWNGLDPQTQEALTEAVIQMEEELPEIYGALVQEEYDRRADDGIVELAPSPEQAAEIQSRALNASWDVLVEELPHTAEVRDLYGAN